MKTKQHAQSHKETNAKSKQPNNQKNTLYLLGGLAGVLLVTTLAFGGLYLKEKFEANDSYMYSQNRFGRRGNITEAREDHDFKYENKQMRRGPAGNHNSNGKHDDREDCMADINNLPKSDLSNAEKDALIQMREEEKLARDVYKTLHDKWDLQIFENISRSEQRHMDMVKLLLDKYELPDPVKNDTVGQFTSSEMQKLYNDLVAQGSKSKVDALKVGATIEDLDIYDLDNLLKIVDNEDIKVVFENLRTGSTHHMNAFTNWLNNEGEKYTPQYIDQKEYDQILDSSSSMGRKQGNRGQNFRMRNM